MNAAVRVRTEKEGARTAENGADRAQAWSRHWRELDFVHTGIFWLPWFSSFGALMSDQPLPGGENKKDDSVTWFDLIGGRSVRRQ